MVVLSVMLPVGLCGTVVAGNLDSAGAPSGGSGMHTIGQLYDYLNSGTDSSIPGGFQEPAGIPGPTMKTLEEVYQDIKAKFGECDVTVVNVESGKKFFSTQSGSWGVRTGTAIVITPTSTPTITPVPWGPTPCAGKGGYWSDDGLGGNGCWFIEDAWTDGCEHTCSDKSLTCDPRAWDDPLCAACMNLGSPPVQLCVANSSLLAPFVEVDGRCYQRDPQDQIGTCDTHSVHPMHRRLCVCKP